MEKNTQYSKINKKLLFGNMNYIVTIIIFTNVIISYDIEQNFDSLLFGGVIKLPD
jgi:hypothetical protein